MKYKLPVVLLIIVVLLSAVPLVAEQSDGDISYTAYDGLTEKEKNIYDGILDMVSNYRSFMSTAGCKSDDVTNAWCAFASDHPEYFWFQTHYVQIVVVKTQDPVSITLRYPLDIADLQAKRAEIDRIAKSIDAGSGSLPDRVKALHNWVTDNVVYDLSTENCCNIYGAIVEKKAKCDGYSYAMNYLCKINGITSICVTGKVIGAQPPGHAWNIIKMDDNKWYYLDSTWDDTKKTGHSYSYFLIGSETPTPSGKFSESRTVDCFFGCNVSESKYNYNPYDGEPANPVWIIVAVAVIVLLVVLFLFYRMRNRKVASGYGFQETVPQNPDSYMRCPQCGAEARQDATYCCGCGRNLKEMGEEKQND